MTTGNRVRRLASIVEGDGEVEALPVLLRRLNARYGTDFEIVRPIRVKRNRFVHRDDEFNRYVRLAAAQASPGGAVLVLLDADDDCPRQVGAELALRVRSQWPDGRFSVVLVNREFEAWFIAASESLVGHRGFEAGPEVDAETPRDAKGWIARRMPDRRYSEILHQASFAAVMDLQQAHDRSRSFRKLCSDWNRLAAAGASIPKGTTP